jgi:hypothetical protein
MFLRVGIGLYLVFIAATRLMGLGSVATFNTMYGWMGQAPVSQTGFAIAMSLFLGLLGLLVLSGKLLVLAGVLVAIVGLASGVGELIASQTTAVNAVDSFTRLSNGVRDILVLGSTGAAIAALDAYIRHRRYRDTEARRGVTMYREETTQRTPVGTTHTTTAGTATGRTTPTTGDEPPTRPYV